jgi:hypothetical protein
VEVTWASALTGPVRPTDHSHQGFYLSANGNMWTVKVAQPAAGTTIFAGTVVINAGRFSSVTPITKDAYINIDGETETITFQLTNNGHITGFKFKAVIASVITFTLNVNGQPAAADQIDLGAAMTPSDSNSPISFSR